MTTGTVTFGSSYNEAEVIGECVGKRVIVLSNSKPYVWAGKITGFQEITQVKHLIPLIENDVGEVFLVLGGIWPYDADVYALLSARGEKAWDYHVALHRLQENRRLLHDRKLVKP
jgi:hypothetical protein